MQISLNVTTVAHGDQNFKIIPRSLICSPYVFFVFLLIVILVISHFGFGGGTLILIASVPWSLLIFNVSKIKYYYHYLVYYINHYDNTSMQYTLILMAVK